MALFGRVCRRLFECFTHFLPQRAAQEPEKLPEECKAFTANDRRHKVTLPEKSPRGERGGGHKDEAQTGGETLEKIKMKKNGRVRQKKREKLSLETLMDGGTELREAGEKKRKERKRKTTVLLVEVKPLDQVGSSVLKTIEGEILMFPSVSEHVALPAARFKLLPPVTKPHTHPQKPVPESEEEFSPIQADHGEVVSLKRSSSQVCPFKRLPPRPTPAPDELFSPRRSSSRVCSPERPPSRKPHPFPSSPSPQLVLVDIEDEENEYVEFTGKTFRDSLKRSRTPEAEVKLETGKWFAWMEEEEEEEEQEEEEVQEEREVQEEEWASEVEEIHGFDEDEDDPSEMGDFKVTQGYTSPDIPKNEIQHDVNVQEKSTRKLPLFLFTWRRKKEKKAIKEKERRENELLLERYRNDPKLKHLWINKHNRNSSSS